MTQKKYFATRYFASYVRARRLRVVIMITRVGCANKVPSEIIRQVASVRKY